MIELLFHQQAEMASEIYEVFQVSYRVEADLIGVRDFPPLQRSIEDIQQTEAIFYGYRIGGEIAGIVEVFQEDGLLDISSLVVSPRFFRRGLASQLMHFVLDEFEYELAEVETAVVNTPAIALYKKLGFVESKKWVPAHGIPKILLQKKDLCSPE